jgi:choline kinase
MIFADIVFDEIILQQMLNTKCDIGIAIDLDWEKSYEERMDNPKADADKVLLSEGKIKKLSKKIQFENNELKVGEFLGIIKLSNKGCKIFKKNCEEFYNKNSSKEEFLKQAKVLHILEEINLNKEIITPIPIEGKWCEIDTPNDLAYAEKLFS